MLPTIGETPTSPLFIATPALRLRRLAPTHGHGDTGTSGARSPLRRVSSPSGGLCNETPRSRLIGALERRGSVPPRAPPPPPRNEPLVPPSSSPHMLWTLLFP